MGNHGGPRPDGHQDRPDKDRRGDKEGPGDHGMWWKNPEVVAKLAITPEQQKKMEDLFTQSRMQLIDLHATLEKEQLVLEPLMNANPVDQAKASAEIDKIAETRAALEKTDAKMLLSIRSVLTPDQWTKLQAEHRERHHDGPPSGPDAARGQHHHGPPSGPPPAGAPPAAE